VLYLVVVAARGVYVWSCVLPLGLRNKLTTAVWPTTRVSCTYCARCSQLVSHFALLLLGCRDKEEERKMRVKQKMQEMRELAQVLFIDLSISRLWPLLFTQFLLSAFRTVQPVEL
jgi:hypothetical protein